MITEQQYREAQAIVDAWNDQQYQEKLYQTQKEWPIGTIITNARGWTRGFVYGYGRKGNEVTLKTINKQYWGDDKGSILAKNAIKLDKI